MFLIFITFSYYTHNAVQAPNYLFSYMITVREVSEQYIVIQVNLNTTSWVTKWSTYDRDYCVRTCMVVVALSLN